MTDSFWVEMGKQLPSAAYERGRDDERAAIVAWLSGQYRTANGYFTHVIAEALRNGEHLQATRTEPRHDESPPPSPE